MTLICNQSTRSPRRRNFKPSLSTQTNKPRGDTDLDWFFCFQTCKHNGTFLNVRRKRKDQDLGGNRTPMLPPKWTVKVKEICYTEQNKEPQKYENRNHLKAEDLQVRREWDWSQLFDKSDWNRAMGQAFCLSSEDDGQCRLRETSLEVEVSRRPPDGPVTPPKITGRWPEFWKVNVCVQIRLIFKTEYLR